VGLRNKKLKEAVPCINKELIPIANKIQAQKQTKI
jgi:hypothetical protein